MKERELGGVGEKVEASLSRGVRGVDSAGCVAR
jgi:hypothetical protein